MWFWLTVLAGLACTALGIKFGFFETMALFFNALVAVFMAIFVTPYLLHIIPQAADFPAGVVFTALVVGVGIFVLLLGLSFFLITGQFRVPFPKVLDVIGAGGLGFLLGVLAISFALVLLSGTPLPILGNLAVDDALAPNMRYLCWWNDGIHRLVRRPTQSVQEPTRQAMTTLLDLARRESQPPRPADPNTPPTPDESGS